MNARPAYLPEYFAPALAPTPAPAAERRFDPAQTPGRRFATVQPPQPLEPGGYLRLPSGLRIAYDLLGDDSGFPLLYFHDTGSSRLEAALLDQSARRCGYRLIAFDRPGVGRSDYFVCKSPREFCEKLLPLLGELGIDRFGIVSKGGGGMYALQLCRMQPERIVGQVNLAGIPVRALASPRGFCAVLAGIVPMTVDALLRLKQFFSPDAPGAVLDRLREELSFADKKVLSRPEVASILEADQAESVRAGYRGMAQDLAISFRKLEVPLEEIAVPTEIWQGCADRLTLRADCEYLASRLPRARLHRVSQRGHFFFIQHMDQVFDSLRRGLREPALILN